MKKMMAFVLACICLLALVACNTGGDGGAQNNAKPAYFVGEVLEVYDSGCLLEVTDEGNYGHLAVGTSVQVTTNIENCPEYAIGDLLKVVFDGTVAESYPPQILHVIQIEKADSTQGGDPAPSATMLVSLGRYSAMTTDGTTLVEVVYDYLHEGETTYEFFIEDPDTIVLLMTEIFRMELKAYPEDRDIDFYQRWITLKQGDEEYLINLGYASDEYGNLYLCQSQKVCEIIEKYIEDHLIP